jgi:hypothetical protein
MTRTHARILSVLLLFGLLGPVTVAAPAAAAGGVAAPRRPAARSETFDVRRPVASETSIAAAELRARSELGRSLGRGVFDLDPKTGTVRVLARLDGFLTAPSVAPAATIVMRYVRDHRRALGLDEEDLESFALARSFRDLDGTRHLAWIQRAHGVQAFDNGLKASVTADGRIVTISGSPAHALGRDLTSTTPALTAREAVDAARPGSAGAASPGDQARLVLFHGGRTSLAWQTLTRIGPGRIDLSVVDATSGRILFRTNVVTTDETATGLAWESFPSNQVPNGGGEQDAVTFPVKGTGKLAGNNAHVYLDTRDDNRPTSSDEIDAVTGFDWSVEAELNITRRTQNCSRRHACSWNRAVAYSWQPNRRQSAVQTYYYLNRFHDHLKQKPIGFTEGAGNFQARNPSGNGKGGDSVRAEVFDGAATDGGLPNKRHYNNANMFTPPDGQAPAMQLYLFQEDRFSRGWPSANAGDDASIVYHEYTHGLSNRLVTYPNGWGALFTAQAGAMGEAWGDWYGMDLLVDEGFEANTNQPGEVKVGEYITGGTGIRFQAIDCPVGAPGAACPAAERSGPGGFTYGDFGRVWFGPEVHSDGEIWAQTLWDLRTKLGVNVARGLVTRAMMLAPPEPSFLDMRNAIVQADRVRHHGSHEDGIWRVFARRGMGYFATTTSSADVHPVESFKPAPDCRTDRCATLKGIVRGVGGEPLAGAVVGMAGLTTGFPGANLIDVTGADGRFSIPKVPFGTYPGLFVDRRAYDVLRTRLRVDQRDEVRTFRPVRDWAAADGGARIESFTGPDYTPFGCGPRGAIDRSLITGWGSKQPTPRQIVIRLPRAVDVSSFGVDPGATCGDLPGAGTERFDIYTRTATGSWVRAWRQTSALAGGTMHRLVPTAGRANVRYVRFVMVSNRDPGNVFVDLSELSVRGS